MDVNQNVIHLHVRVLKGKKSIATEICFINAEMQSTLLSQVVRKCFLWFDDFSQNKKKSNETD